MQNGVAARVKLVRVLVQIRTEVPHWTRESAFVLVKPNCSRHLELGEEYDLAAVHREVLDDVVDGGEHGGLTTLYRQRTRQVVLRQLCEHLVGLSQHDLEIG